MERTTEAERANIAGRIAEAYRTLNLLPDHDRGRLGMQVMQWPGVIYDPSKMEPGAWKGVTVRPPLPTGEQIDRMNEMLDGMLWLAANYRNAARAVYLCHGCGMRTGRAASILGCSRETARIWKNSGLDLLIVSWRRKRAV